MPEVPGSTLGGDVQFSFFFLVAKNSMIVSLKWHRPLTKRTSASAIRQLLAILTTINFEEIDHFEAVFLLNIDKNATSFMSDF